MQQKPDEPAVPDTVAGALERLAIVLAEARMSATVTLHGPGAQAGTEFTLGMERASAPHHVLHAKPATGEPSHLGIEDL